MISTETIQLCIDKPLDNWLSRSSIMELMREVVASREAQGVVIELHMGAAIHVFDALKDTKIESNVRNANLGVMGASLVELWTSKIGGTLEYLTANGGCSLKIYAAPQLPAVLDEVCNESHGMTISAGEFYESQIPMPDVTSPNGWTAVSNNPPAIKAHVELYMSQADTQEKHSGYVIAQPENLALSNFRDAMEGIGHIKRTLTESFGGLHGTHVEPDVIKECKAICDAIHAAYVRTGDDHLTDTANHQFESLHAKRLSD